MNFQLNVLIDINSVLKPPLVCNKAEKEYHNQVSDLETENEDLQKIERDDYNCIKRSARKNTEKRISLLQAAQSIKSLADADNTSNIN